jgi:hypothetical protein
MKSTTIATTSTVRCLGVALALMSTVSLANQPTQKDIDQMRDSLMANFDAQSREDVDGVVASLSPKGRQMAGPTEIAELRDELKKLFEETNLRLRLVSLHVYDYSPPSITGCAYADVVQLTLPAEHSYADLEEYPADMSSLWRHHSAALPTSQLVKYVLRFDYDPKARTWKPSRIVEPPKPVGQWPENTRDIMEGATVTPTSRTGIKAESSRVGNR